MDVALDIDMITHFCSNLAYGSFHQHKMWRFAKFIKPNALLAVSAVSIVDLLYFGPL